MGYLGEPLTRDWISTVKIDFEPLAPAKSISLDLFPASIKSEDDVLYTKARIVVTDAHFYIFTVGSSGFPILTESGALYDFQRNGSVTSCTIQDESGRILHVNKDAGCGCGNTLVSFQPFLGVPFANLT